MSLKEDIKKEIENQEKKQTKKQKIMSVKNDIKLMIKHKIPLKKQIELLIKNEIVDSLDLKYYRGILKEIKKDLAVEHKKNKTIKTETTPNPKKQIPIQNKVKKTATEMLSQPVKLIF